MKAQVTWGSAGVTVTSTSDDVGSVDVPLQTMDTGDQAPRVELGGPSSTIEYWPGTSGSSGLPEVCTAVTGHPGLGGGGGQHRLGGVPGTVASVSSATGVTTKSVVPTPPVVVLVMVREPLGGEGVGERALERVPGGGERRRRRVDEGEGRGVTGHRGTRLRRRS